MWKLVGWIATTTVAALLVWQIAMATEPFLSRTTSGLLLATISFMAGLRIATDSTYAYIRDLQRNNKVLAEHQRDLEEMNELLLKQINAESPEPSKAT